LNKGALFRRQISLPKTIKRLGWSVLMAQTRGNLTAAVGVYRHGFRVYIGCVGALPGRRPSSHARELSITSRGHRGRLIIEAIHVGFSTKRHGASTCEASPFVARSDPFQTVSARAEAPSTIYGIQQRHKAETSNASHRILWAAECRRLLESSATCYTEPRLMACSTAARRCWPLPFLDVEGELSSIQKAALIVKSFLVHGQSQ
jgi:hypothetical protein